MYRKLISILAFAAVFVLSFSCKKDGPDSNSVIDPKLDGIWKLVNISYEGGSVRDLNELYAVADAENKYIIFIADGDGIHETNDPLFDLFRMEAHDGNLILMHDDDYSVNYKDPEGDNLLQVPYDITKDKNTLNIHTKIITLVSPEKIEDEPEGLDIDLRFERDLALEGEIESATKGSDDWFRKAVSAAYVGRWTSVGENGIDEKDDFVDRQMWSNSLGWEPENWMSKLSDDLPVACVNIPGSHDSSTSKKGMSFLADWSDSWVQSYTIEEQYNMGARYFDLRVGTDLESSWLGLVVRAKTAAERAEVEDLKMYHGPLCTNTYFLQTLEMLAKKVMSSGTEFIFVNVQAERESPGLIYTANFELQQKLFNDGSKDWYYSTVIEQSMDIANRLMKEFSTKYGDDIFIPYTPDLTVGKARGHIIIMESSSYMSYQCKQYAYDYVDGRKVVTEDKNWLRASFISGWPDNRSGWASMYTYTLTDDLKNNLYVQSYYEMATDNKDRISLKEEKIKSLAKDITEYNRDPGHINILGFNALNANTGSATGLEARAFAHEFNGFAYQMFIDNMLDPDVCIFRSGIVPMDHYGARVYDGNEKIKLYGDLLSWAVIESNFY